MSRVALGENVPPNQNIPATSQVGDEKPKTEGEKKLPWVRDPTPLPGAKLGQYLLVLKAIHNVPDVDALNFLLSQEKFACHLRAFVPVRFNAVYTLLERYEMSMFAILYNFQAHRPMIEAKLNEWLATPPKKPEVTPRPTLSQPLQERLLLAGCWKTPVQDDIKFLREFLLDHPHFSMWLRRRFKDERSPGLLDKLTAADPLLARNEPLNNVFWKKLHENVEQMFLTYVGRRIKRYQKKGGTDPAVSKWLA